ncbi:hypothetical protein HPB50_023027 [Hyalomma asiaticum]|uniref:Uncharacterized protein n=1 Tax=Hyalomma asiaticum TaxID=266040 RepID=A0ACB7SH86_HYAAI|nr:hypothetical protein HPB50_023027 [Hyalomma asiaticum]
MRKTCKHALGLLSTMSRGKLPELGIHNKWEELAEADKISHIERLKLVIMGRGTLRQLGYPVDDESSRKQGISLSLDETTAADIPRNMHLDHNKKDDKRG